MVTTTLWHTLSQVTRSPLATTTRRLSCGEKKRVDRWVASADTKLCVDPESSKATRPLSSILSSIYIVLLVRTPVMASKEIWAPIPRSAPWCRWCGQLPGEKGSCRCGSGRASRHSCSRGPNASILPSSERRGGG